jgi:hypothetical protein
MVGELAKNCPDHVKTRSRSRNDKQRLATHVLPLLRHVPIAALTLPIVDNVMASLPAQLTPTTRRRLAQAIFRACKLAVHPLRLAPASLIPSGWPPLVPKGSQRKQEMPSHANTIAF